MSWRSIDVQPGVLGTDEQNPYLNVFKQFLRIHNSGSGSIWEPECVPCICEYVFWGERGCVSSLLCPVRAQRKHGGRVAVNSVPYEGTDGDGELGTRHPPRHESAFQRSLGAQRGGERPVGGEPPRNRKRIWQTTIELKWLFRKSRKGHKRNTKSTGCKNRSEYVETACSVGCKMVKKVEMEI